MPSSPTCQHQRKPQIAIVDQGPLSEKLAAQTNLTFAPSETPDYWLGYGPLEGPLVTKPIDALSETHYLQLKPVNKNQGALLIDGLQGTLGFRRHPARLLHEPLISAIGAHTHYQPSVIDATAGWGTDAFLLASFGCQVKLIEADPLIGALLSDALRRWHNAGQHTIPLTIGHATLLMPTLATADFPDIIYLDPMFPPRQKTAAVKKNMAFLQQWLDKTENIDEEMQLLDTARQYAKKRVVVKRPQSAPYLAQQKPSGAITTRHHRYDIYASFIKLRS